MSGLALQALMVDTIGAGLPVREHGRFPFLAGAALGTASPGGHPLLARRAGPSRPGPPRSPPRLSGPLPFRSSADGPGAFPVTTCFSCRLSALSPWRSPSGGHFSSTMESQTDDDNVRALAFGLLLLTVPTAAEAPKPIAIVIVYGQGPARRPPGPTPRSGCAARSSSGGTALELGPGSCVALAFATGRRYEIWRAEPARLSGRRPRLEDRAASALSPSVPPLLRLSPIAAEDQPGPSAGAVRIRAKKSRGAPPPPRDDGPRGIRRPPFPARHRRRWTTGSRCRTIRAGLFSRTI